MSDLIERNDALQVIHQIEEFDGAPSAELDLQLLLASQKATNGDLSGLYSILRTVVALTKSDAIHAILQLNCQGNTHD